MSIWTKFNYPLLLLIFIPLLLTIIWFRNGLILGGGEEGLIFYNPAKTIEVSKTTWIEMNTGIPQLYWLPRLPFLLISSIFTSILGLNSFLVQAGLFLTLMLTGVISTYYLTLNLLQNSRAKSLVAIVTAIFYLLNPFSLSQIWGRGIYPQFFAFALLPLSLLLFTLALKKKSYVYILLMLLSSVLFSLTFGNVTYIVTYWVILSLFYIWWLIVNRFKKKEIFFGFTFLSTFFVLWTIVNSWWLLPIIISGSNVLAPIIEGANENIGSLLGVSRNFPPDIIIRLLQRTYYYDASAFSPLYLTWPFQLISWIPVAFVLYSLFKIFRNHLSQFHFFAVLLILGLTVSLGANPPFGWLFLWVFKKIAILQSFRNPFEKFGLVYALGYSAVFAYGLVYFFEGKKIKWFGLGLILFLICIVFAFPMWTGRVIAGADKKIGLDVPVYYKDFNNWQKTNGEDYKVLMTPVWSGEGAFYNWGKGTRYQGLDPMYLMLDSVSISSGPQVPFYFDFITAFRKYMERMNVAPAFALLRVKYLADRKDAIFITDREKDQYKFLTSHFLTPSGLNKEIKAICQNILRPAESGGSAWIACEIPEAERDFSKIKYLRMKIKTQYPAILEIALRDSNNTRIRWDGKRDPDYKVSSNNWEDIVIALGAPTEYNNNINFSNTAIIELVAHPAGSQQTVGQLELSGIGFDLGVETPINEFKKAAEFGNLTVYEATNFNSPPEFGVLSKIQQVGDFKELFSEADVKRDLIHTLGFIVPQQNSNKDLSKLDFDPGLKALEQEKISDTRYWLKPGTDNSGLILLSKTFNPGWKVIAGVEKNELTGNLFDDIKLLQKETLSEDEHFVINGYANLWKVGGGASEYAVIFIPQIIANIGLKISIFSLIGIFLPAGIFIAVKKLRPMGPKVANQS